MIQYKYRHAKTPMNEEFKMNLHVLGAWYACNDSRILASIENKEMIEIQMQNYVSTIKVATTILGNSTGLLSYKIPFEIFVLSLQTYFWILIPLVDGFRCVVFHTLDIY